MNEHPVRRLARRLVVLAGVMLVVALVAGRSQAANENWCPTDGWNCQQYDDCNDVSWCKNLDWDCSAILFGMQYHPKKKYHKIKRCTKETFVVFCSSCGPIEDGPRCCTQPDLQEAPCPQLGQCP